MKPILVGQAPARSGDGRPFTGQTGRMLQSLLRFDSYEQLSECFDMYNLLPRKMQKPAERRGDEFPMPEARRGAIRLRNGVIKDGNEVILCGNKVSEAFHPSLVARPLLRPTLMRESWGWWTAYRFPHPSGLNHFWNYSGNRERAARFLIDLSSPDRSIDHATDFIDP